LIKFITVQGVSSGSSFEKAEAKMKKDIKSKGYKICGDVHMRLDQKVYGGIQTEPLAYIYNYVVEVKEVG
jgi:hypothetical protein